MNIRRLETALAVVDRSLRKEFPDDFHKRCSYAAQGVGALLKDLGMEPKLVGGNFAAFAMSKDRARAAFQGFGYGEGQSAHFWIEADNHLIDLGAYFLPYESSFPIVRTPTVAWNLEHPLPKYLRYQALERTDQGIIFPDAAIMERTSAFIAQCKSRMAQQIGPVKLPTWLVTGAASVSTAARKGDPWAQGALKFEGLVDPASIPF